MDDLKKILDPSEFRTDDDFGGIVADMEACKQNGETFYLCRESKLKKLIDREKMKSVYHGMLAGASCVAAGVLFDWVFPEIMDGVRHTLFERVHK